MPRALSVLEAKVKEFRRSRDEKELKEKALAWRKKQKQYKTMPSKELLKRIRRDMDIKPVEMGKFSMKTRSKNKIAFAKAKALAKAKKD